MGKNSKNVKSNKKRVFVAFDGSNFYHLLSSIQIRNTLEYDYMGIAKWLSGEHYLVKANYYVGVIRYDSRNPAKSKKMISAQQKIFSSLRKQKINLIKGYILSYILKSGNSFHEKGVDVKIAVDMLVGAYEDKFDVLILISYDTDLLPAIEKVIDLGKEVEYVGLRRRPSYGLINKVSKSRLLTNNDIEKFTKI